LRAATLSLILTALAIAAAATGCQSYEGKLARAEKAFDAGKFENAQFAYFELLSESVGPEQVKAAESLKSRLKPLVTSDKFDPAKYEMWSAVLETSPELADEIDAAFAGALGARAQKLIDEGKYKEAGIVLGYVPTGKGDPALMAKLKKAAAEGEKGKYNAGLELYKQHKYDEAIEAWKTLDPGSDWYAKAKPIIEKIPAEKLKYYIEKARKRPLDGFKLKEARPIARVIFNRVKGQAFETQDAPEGHEFLKVEAVISRDIDLCAWYWDGSNFVSVGGLQREFVKIDAEDPDEVKRSYKQKISSDHPMEVVYFIVTKFNFHKEHDIYVSEGSPPYVADDLAEASIVASF